MAHIGRYSAEESHIFPYSKQPLKSTYSQVERDIREALTAAKQGDVAAFKLLCGFSYHDRDIFKRITVLISPNLRAKPSIIHRKTQKPCKEDILAVLALQILDFGFRAWKKDNEIQYKMESILGKEWMNVLRWINHLMGRNWHWLNRLTTHGSPATSDTMMWDDADVSADTDAARAVLSDGLIGCIPVLFIAMQEHSDDILDRMKDNEHIGQLLAQIIIVAGRHKLNSDLLLGSLLMGAYLPPGPDKRWESDFFRHIDQHPTAFIQSINRAILFYIPEPIRYSIELSALFPTLFKCIQQHDGTAYHLLDVFLEQKDTIRAFTLALRGCIDVLGHQNPSNGSDQDDTFTEVLCITTILTGILCHGGPEVVSMSLNQGLLDALLALHAATIIGDQGSVSGGGADLLDHMACQLVESLIRFSVYPSVLRPFFELFAIRAEICRKILEERPSRLPTYSLFLGRLIAKVEAEFSLLHNHGGVEGNHPNYLSPFKFCDNAKCPFPGKAARLGQCSGCLSGYYCSRRCQAAVWKEGHRHECKKIARIKRAKTGFPMVFTIHDREYFRRTLVSRFRQWKTAEFQVGEVEAHPSITRNSVVVMDLTSFPASLETRKHDPEHDLPPPYINAKIVTFRKLGDDQVGWVSVGLPLELVDTNSEEG